jgi:hypothetical protein
MEAEALPNEAESLSMEAEAFPKQAEEDFMEAKKSCPKMTDSFFLVA